MHLLGAPGATGMSWSETSWWEEADAPGVDSPAASAGSCSLKPTQGEFWSVTPPAAEPAAVAVVAPVAAPAVAPAVARGPAATPRLAASAPRVLPRSVARVSTYARPAGNARRCEVARFLRINGALYDGHDEGNWLSLPRHTSRRNLARGGVGGVKEPGGRWSLKAVWRSLAGCFF